MKQTALAVTASDFSGLMVLPVVRFVNLSAGKPGTVNRTLYADGWPTPPFPPKLLSTDAGTLLADGWPTPPFPPKLLSTDAGTLLADGWPTPPFPPKLAQTAVSA